MVCVVVCSASKTQARRLLAVAWAAPVMRERCGVCVSVYVCVSGHVCGAACPVGEAATTTFRVVEPQSVAREIGCACALFVECVCVCVRVQIEMDDAKIEAFV